MRDQKELLSPIFEWALSLDNKKPGSSRSLHLFERMAERLDEIAANTRGLVKGIIAHASSSSQGNASGTQKEQKKAQKPIQATVKAKWSTRITNDKVKSGASQKPILASVNTVPDKEQATLANRALLSDGSAASVRPVQKEETDKKATTSNGSVISQPKSAIANNEAKEKRNAEENGNRIAEAVLSGMGKFGNLLKSGADVITQNNDIKDAAGYALGGPFYGALKEIKEALPDISSEKPDDEKERKADSRKLLKAINDPAGRQRDDGRFIKPDQNAARRQLAQTEVAEAQLALDEKEAKKEEKRHKELLRAVKANKRGMLDRFLDRRMGLGRPGRDRIIRERSVHEKGKPGAKAVQAKGPKPDSRLLPNNGSNGRLSREAEIGSRARRKGILSRAGGVAQSAGKAVTGTLAMGSKALGGMLRRLPGIGQALALGMAAYEGFQGWNDKELHQQAFGLKDGQEATTGQKASSAAASILDMGGLTSGLLGMFGIEFDKAGVARSIYELGSNIGQLASDFMANAGPILSSVWSGISDIGTKAWEGAKNIGNAVADIAVGLWDKGTGLVSSIWEGAKNIGGTVAEVAGGIWDKGASLISRIWDGAQNIAGSIATFAGNALEKGAGMISSLWEGYTGAVGKIWGGLTDFAQSAVAKGGEILSGLWSKATELPGKIIDGAADLAKGALETGVKILSDGWNAVKNWGKGLFSSDEAEAKPVNQAEIKQTSTENAESPQTANKAIAQEVSVKPEQVAAPGIGAQATPIINPALDSKLSSINTEENAKKSATSSESVSSTLGLKQMKQNDKENKGREEINDNLEDANKNIKNISKLLDNEFKGNLNDPYLIDVPRSTDHNVINYTTASDYDNGATQSFGGESNTSYGTTAQTDGATGTLSQRNLSVHNYGNVKLNSKEYKAYATKKDGLMDVGARALRYNNAPERGWNAKTLQEMVNIYAPPSENDSKGYAQFLANKLGVNKDEQINFRDPKILAGLIRWMPKMEHGADIDEKTAYEAAEAVLRGEKAQVIGTAPDKQGHYKRFIEQTAVARTAGQNLQFDGSSQGVRLKDDGKTVDLSTVQGIESLRLQSGVNIDKMHPEAVSRLGKMAQDYEKITGQKLEISEGYRDYAEQVRVKKKYGADAATPGKSTHGMGNTFDIAKSKIVDVENRLKQAGINPVQFFKDHGFERSAYRPGASRQHDESWHLEATDLRTAEMQADRKGLRSGKKTGAEYMTAEQKSRYMPSKIPYGSAIIHANSTQPQQTTHVAKQVAEAQISMSQKEKNFQNPHLATVLNQASKPMSLAQVNCAAAVGVPALQPIEVPAIREIDPAREVKTSSNDNGPILKILGEILAAIQAGNKKMGNSGTNDEPPSISTEYDDLAAQGLAADTA